ncbi:MAG: hypothetical protein LUD16_07115 [Lachnospiraceae bacterium]|nr:hypothetical protein [Lachnospiraceae bacterium]
MSTIEATVSLMQGMTETSRQKVLDYVKLIYNADTTSNPFAPLSADEIMEKLAVGRAQNKAGEGIPFGEGMKRIGVELLSGGEDELDILNTYLEKRLQHG